MEVGLREIINQKENKIQEQQQQIKILEEEKNILRGQNQSLAAEIEQTRTERSEYQKTIEEKFDQRLTIIQEELRATVQADRGGVESSRRRGPSE